MKKRVLKSISALLLLAVTAASASPLVMHLSAASSSVSEWERQRQELQSKIDEYNKSIETAKNDIDGALERKAQIDEQIDLITEKIASTNAIIDQYDSDIQKINSRIVDMDSEIDTKYERFESWLRMMQLSGDVNYLEMVLSADSFVSFLETVDRMGTLIKYQNTVMEDLRADVNAASEQRDEADTLRAEQLEVKQQLESDNAQLTALQKKSENYITELKKNQAQYERYLADAEAADEKLGNEIEAEFGIPIVNKRISVTPIALIGGAACHTIEDFASIAKTLDKVAHEVGVNFLGGYSALVSKGMTPADELLIRSIPLALSTTERVCSSVNLGSTKTGINMDAVKLMGEMVKETAEYTKEDDSLGCAKLVVFCNAPDDNPFMAGAFHGVTEADKIINVGVSGPGVVKTALEKVRGENFEVLCETIKKTAFKVTRVGQLVAQEASRMLNVPFGIVDLSLAPTPAIGDSVADILCEIGLEHAGAPGTTAALALLNDQVKKGGVMASSYVGGLSGAFIPVSEDQGMIDAVKVGALTIEKLEAMTCVCSVGLDMIAIPGKTKASTISGIIADEMAIGMINQKTTAVRLIPVIGKDVGDTAQFGGLLGYAPIIPVNEYDCSAFVNRKGRIPAPVHSFKN